MPLIKPSIDKEPDYEELYERYAPDMHERIRKLLDMRAWICPDCGLKNHELNKKCANFRCNKERV